MKHKSFGYTALALGFLEKLLGTRFNLYNLNKVPKDQPIMFVANHFTRSETFFLPYLLYKYADRKVKCLADDKIFVGNFGRFLNSIGAISVKDPNRDTIIVNDLVNNYSDWIIYPEGSMIKSKEIRNDGAFINYTPYRIGPVRTGSAVLALKSQLIRSDIIESHHKQINNTNLNHLCKDRYNPYLERYNTYVVPVNITYYPIRPGVNKIQKLATRLLKDLPSQILEELEIEGNILLNSEINISFGDAIDVGQYIKNTRDLIQQIPIIKGETKNNFVIRYLRNKLTYDFMQKIYFDIQINFDHIFISVLHYFPEEKLNKQHLKRMIYYISHLLHKTHKYNLHSSLFEENLMQMFLDEPNRAFDGVFDLAIKQNILICEGDILTINKNYFNKTADFHQIRLENTLQVIANEFALVDNVNNVTKKVVKIPHEELVYLVYQQLYLQDKEIFLHQYQTFFDKNFTKPQHIGAPYLLEDNIQNNCVFADLGIILVHGYKSSPAQTLEMATFFNNKNIPVYGVRLSGHGTSPLDLKNTSWQQWLISLQRGYAVLSQFCQKIIIVGFSTGGLLTLVKASMVNNNSKLKSIAVINSALKLKDIRAKMVSGINLWNELLEKFDINKGKFEFIDDKPETPEFNYSRHYLSSVVELEKLMKHCQNNLSKINISTLVVQAMHDPVVNPVSGDIIIDNISCEKKFLFTPNFHHHTIITGWGKETIFTEINNFIKKTN
jgi:esterase/lipase/1-acyl-sn-glycerol-3-phosphate acyltransferase